MKTIRTIRTIHIEELDEDIPQIPRFQIGEWAEIYNGVHEGHEFMITDIRWSHDSKVFQYLYKFVGNHWYPEHSLVKR